VRDGMVVERGNHEELMHAGGLYAELHEIQFQPSHDREGVV